MRVTRGINRLVSIKIQYQLEVPTATMMELPPQREDIVRIKCFSNSLRNIRVLYVILLSSDSLETI